MSSGADRDPVTVRVITQLRAINHTSSWEKTLAIGRIVFDEIFNADLAEWRAKRGNKANSLRKLAAHAACPFGKSALSAAVNVYVFVTAHPAAAHIENVGPAHINNVWSLPPAVALELLSSAGREGWSVRTLAERARLRRKSQASHRGRPRATVEHRVEVLAQRTLKLVATMHELLPECKQLHANQQALVASVVTAVSLLAGNVALPRSRPQLVHSAPDRAQGSASLYAPRTARSFR